jgi:hypothetical protein
VVEHRGGCLPAENEAVVGVWSQPDRRRRHPWVLRVRGVRIAFEPRKFMVRAGGCSLSGRSLYPPGGGMPGYRDRQRGEQIRHTCDGRLNTKGLIPSISGGSTGP